MHYPTISAFLLATALPAVAANTVITDETHPSFDRIAYSNEVARRVAEEFDGTTLDELAALDSLDAEDTSSDYEPGTYLIGRHISESTHRDDGEDDATAADEDGEDDDDEQFQSLLLGAARGNRVNTTAMHHHHHHHMYQRHGTWRRPAFLGGACRPVTVRMGSSGRTRTVDSCGRDAAAPTAEAFHALVSGRDTNGVETVPRRQGSFSSLGSASSGSSLGKTIVALFSRGGLRRRRSGARVEGSGWPY